MPAVPVILQAAKVSTPAVAVLVLAVQARVAPLPGWLLIAIVIEAVDVGAGGDGVAGGVLHRDDRLRGEGGV